MPLTPIPQLMLEQIAQAVLGIDINQGSIATAYDNLIQRFLLQRTDTTTYCLHAPIRAYLQTKLTSSTPERSLETSFHSDNGGFCQTALRPTPCRRM